MAPKFALFTKGSKLSLNKGLKNMFEFLQSCAQPSIMFSWQNKKNIDTFWLKKVSYQELSDTPSFLSEATCMPIFFFFFFVLVGEIFML